MKETDRRFKFREGKAGVLKRASIRRDTYSFLSLKKTLRRSINKLNGQSLSFWQLKQQQRKPQWVIQFVGVER